LYVSQAGDFYTQRSTLPYLSHGGHFHRGKGIAWLLPRARPDIND
jgi:hypothetical protein